MDSLLELFVHIDDFWQIFRPIWHEHLLASGPAAANPSDEVE